MTPVQFLVNHSWWFVSFAVLSIVCFVFKVNIREKADDKLFDFEDVSNSKGIFISYSKPFKQAWYLGQFGFWALLYLIAKLPFVLTFVGLALVSMFGK